MTMPQFDPIYWKHAIWKASSGAVLVLLGGIPTVVLGWDSMIISGKIVACTGLAAQVIKSLDMFGDQTMSRLAAGKLPVKLEGQNGTKHITKEEVAKDFGQ
jgi:hypothetical protein